MVNMGPSEYRFGKYFATNSLIILIFEISVGWSNREVNKKVNKKVNKMYQSVNVWIQLMKMDIWGRYLRWISEVDIWGGYLRWISEVDIWGGYLRWISEVDIWGGYLRWISEVDI